MLLGREPRLLEAGPGRRGWLARNEEVGSLVEKHAGSADVLSGYHRAQLRQVHFWPILIPQPPHLMQ